MAVRVDRSTAQLTALKLGSVVLALGVGHSGRAYAFSWLVTAVIIEINRTCTQQLLPARRRPHQLDIDSASGDAGR